MKKLIYGLYGAFFVLTGITFYIAHSVNDGVVTDHYYDKSRDFFSHKHEGEAIGTSAGGTADANDCDIDRGPCSKMTGNAEVILDVSPKPVKAMEELIFHLAVRRNSAFVNERSREISEQPEKITLELGMPGMYMGENRVIVRKGPDGTYTGKGIIPKCRSGRRLWRASATVPGAGKADFEFNVSH